MKVRALLILLAGILCGCNPSPDTDNKPYVRWWWNGDKVESEEIVRELRLLHDQGIGGVEINPIEFPDKSDPLNKKELVWLSDEWMDMLQVAFDEARRLGMKCDLIVGSGWPFGAETLPMEDRAQVMLTWAQPLEGGTHYTITKDEIYRAVDPGVTVQNPDRRFFTECIKLTPDPIEDLSQVVDLTSDFPGDTIRIDVPEGPHFLYVMVRVQSFACVINGAPGAAGSILNHLDAAAVRRYLDNMSDRIENRLGPLSDHIRALFTDSMELEGCNWTEDFEEEFLRRRGYDIMPWLPFTMFKVGRLGDVIDYNFGAKKGSDFEEKVNRARFDFELTKAELYRERFTETYLQWCRDKGVKSRAQAYGRGFFPLESSLGYDIPEGESWTTNWLQHRLGEEMGDEDYRRGRGYTMINKYVSSAANLTGKREVTSEEMTNTYRVFTA
ncbi:MAG: glycoside hydrolase family 2, partial [Bacteroidales bacterium]|nr:glycoside hydrolase family 2 [Bacteroidales bacterium]